MKEARTAICQIPHRLPKASAVRQWDMSSASVVPRYHILQTIGLLGEDQPHIRQTSPPIPMTTTS